MSRILSKDDFAPFRTSTQDEEGITKISIYGACIHSALVILTLELAIDEDRLKIFPHAVIAGTNPAATVCGFNETIAVPPNVAEVYFGYNEDIIWTRQ